MKKLIPIVLLLLFSIGKAQEKSNSTSYFLINTGYTNLNGNYFELGPEFYFIQKNDNIINLSATANMAYFNDQFVIVPEVGIGYLFNTKNPNSKANPYREYINASFYSIRVNASPWKDRKSTRLNSSLVATSYAVFCLKKKKIQTVT